MNSKYGDVVNRDHHAKAAARNTAVKEELHTNSAARKIVCVAAKPARVPMSIAGSAAHGTALPATAPTGGTVIKREPHTASGSYVAAGIVIKGYTQPAHAASTGGAMETDDATEDYEFVSDDTAFNAWLQSTYYIDSSCTSFNSRGF